MGSTETDKSAKDPKTPTPPPAATQEQSSATSAGAVNPEWSGFQAYSPMPPHGYVASSPQAHPYMWSVQPMMPPPYGTPSHPYMAMYPHGVYAHPSMPPGTYPYSPYAVPPVMAEASGNTPVGMDVDGKLPEGKEKLPIKRSKGSLGSLNMITGKKNEQGKTKGPLVNGGACSKSGESASDGSSEGSDANSQNDSQIKSSDRQESLEADASQNGSSMHGSQNGLSNPPHAVVNPTMPIAPMQAAAAGAVAGPATNLNIGMDYWGAAAPSAMPAMHGKVATAPVPTGIVTAGSRDNLQSQLWLQDEREIKRQRRKQSNRESARRSRLRKQAECDELAQRADALNEENASLRSEISRIRNDYEKLLAENNMLKAKRGGVSDNAALDRTKHLSNESQPTEQKEQGESGH